MRDAGADKKDKKIVLNYSILAGNRYVIKIRLLLMLCFSVAILLPVFSQTKAIKPIPDSVMLSQIKALQIQSKKQNSKVDSLAKELAANKVAKDFFSSDLTAQTGLFTLITTLFFVIVGFIIPYMNKRWYRKRINKINASLENFKAEIIEKFKSLEIELEIQELKRCRAMYYIFEDTDNNPIPALMWYLRWNDATYALIGKVDATNQKNKLESQKPIIGYTLNKIVNSCKKDIRFMNNLIEEFNEIINNLLKVDIKENDRVALVDCKQKINSWYWSDLDNRILQESQTELF